MTTLSGDYLHIYILEDLVSAQREMGRLLEGRDTPKHTLSYEEVYAKLPDFRRARADSLRNEAVRRQSVLAFGMLMYGLEDIGIDMDNRSVWDELGYETGEYGKPYFAGLPGVHFSFAHTRGAVACAVSGSEIGCDIEHIRQINSLYSVAKRTLTAEEMSQCMRVPSEGDIYGRLDGICIDPVAFLHFWTRKEAYVKYTGRGLKDILATLDIIHVSEYLHSESIGEHVWAVCTSKPAVCISTLL